MTPAERVQRILANAVGRDLSSWERFEFLPNIKQRHSLSQKQEQTLRAIELRVVEGERG
jgi:hypothetical protein